MKLKDVFWEVVALVGPGVLGAGFWWFRFPAMSLTELAALVILELVYFMAMMWIKYPRLSREKKGG